MLELLGLSRITKHRLPISMLFKRKPKNRRLGREYVLDVKVRSSVVRATRVRIASIALGSLLGAVLGIYLLWRTGEWTLNRLVYENRSFAIQDLDIQTDGVISIEQLRRWAGVSPGQNLFALDLARVKRNLELAPPIASASVERVLPRTLRLLILERDPIAQISVARPRPEGGIEWDVFQLDAEGYVMPPLSSNQRSAPAPQPADILPAISGIGSQELRPGKRLEAPQVVAALELVTDFEQSPMRGLADLKRIDVSSPEALVVTTGQGSEITFGLTGIEQQIRRWRAVFDAAQKTGKAIASLDLAVTNNLPARWLEASSVPPSSPRLPKQARIKKKHV